MSKNDFSKNTEGKLIDLNSLKKRYESYKKKPFPIWKQIKKSEISTRKP